MHSRDEQAEREYVVAQAITNIRARGFEPRPEVIALYARYASGDLSRAEVQAEMGQRVDRLRARQARPAANHRMQLAQEPTPEAVVGPGA